MTTHSTSILGATGRHALAACASLCLAGPVSASVLFSDNFNTADTSNFDGAPTAGRLSGPVSAVTALASFGSQQDITGNRLDLDPVGGLRFGGETTRYNWAGSPSGSSILAAGGFEVTFDWIYGDTTAEWIAWKVGTDNADSGVNAGSVDHALLLRQNGNTERWDNGVNLGNGGAFTPNAGILTTYPVKLSYSFSSFADGANITLVATVNGTQVANDAFTWDGNGGEMRMEIQSGIDGNFIDNLTISTLPVPEPTSAALVGLGGLAGLFLRGRRQG
jgi:hypothetical protein